MNFDLADYLLKTVWGGLTENRREVVVLHNFVTSQKILLAFCSSPEDWFKIKCASLNIPSEIFLSRKLITYSQHIFGLLKYLFHFISNPRKYSCRRPLLPSYRPQPKEILRIQSGYWMPSKSKFKQRSRFLNNL